eukprot:TRINITY_DN10118_c0_g1_i6.p1 TRINITY_DN10118_c0_g1~~TRINITY_DN10118_c0_g1_i6.p1  ORF type:complete len:198 (-),score=25.84 TRINITY_DN10118_c0_g1_i6:21-614(-)
MCIRDSSSVIIEKDEAVVKIGEILQNVATSLEIPDPLLKMQEDPINSIKFVLEKIVEKYQKLREQISTLTDDLARERRIKGEIMLKEIVSEDKAIGRSKCSLSQDSDIYMGYPKREMPTLWVPDDFSNKCMNCKTGFGCIFSRRQHCRRCGGLFCSSCANRTAFVPPFYTIAKVRVCQDCSNRLAEGLDTSFHKSNR